MTKIEKYVSGGQTRCVQAAFRMLVYAYRHVDIDKQEADRITGYVEGRGTWQFRMFLGLAQHGLHVTDHEDFDVNLFLKNQRQAISRQVGDEVVVQGILDETDLEAEHRAVRACLASELIEFKETVPSFDDFRGYISEGCVCLANVNRRILDRKPGREGHILLVEDISDSEVLVHDPGPGGGLNITLERDLFAEAWTSPSPEVANIIAIREPRSGHS